MPTKKAKAKEKPQLLTVHVVESDDYENAKDDGRWEWEVKLDSGESLGQATWDKGIGTPHRERGWWALSPNGREVLCSKGPRVPAVVSLVLDRFPDYRYWSCERAQSSNAGTYDFHFTRR